MQKATLIKQGQDPIVVESGSQEANQAFAQGYQLPEAMTDAMRESYDAAGLLKPGGMQTAGGDINILEGNVNQAGGRLQELGTGKGALDVFQEAVRKLKGSSQAKLGQSETFQEAGLTGYGSLANSLNARTNELEMSRADIRNATSGMANIYSDKMAAASQQYDTAIDLYKTKAAELQRINEVAVQHEYALKLMDHQAQVNTEMMNNPTIKQILEMNEDGLVWEDGVPVRDISGADVEDVMNAIKKIESGGNYDAKGGSGEYGAYQFMPATWTDWSSKYAAEVLKSSDGNMKMTPENQDAVARWKIQKLLDAGNTPEQVASIWNSGKPEWEGNVGTNSHGVKYDVPGYVNRFRNALRSDMEFMTKDYTETDMNNAIAIMAPYSTLKPSDYPQKDRAGIGIALNELKSTAVENGDLYGVMKASAGGQMLDASSREKIGKFNTSIELLDSLKREFDTLSAKGGTGSFKGRINEKKFWDEDVATIKAKIQGIIPTIARGVFGEVGVLTDTDIENYKQTIPNVKTPTEAVDRIFNGILETIESTILSTYESNALAGIDMSGFADQYIKIKEKVQNLKTSASGASGGMGTADEILNKYGVK